MLASLLPWPRAIGSALVMAAIGALGHVVGGVPPDFTGRLLVFVIAAAVVLRSVQGLPGSPLRTALVLAVGQVVFHVLVRPMHAGGHAHTMPDLVTTHDHSVGLRRSAAPLGPIAAQWLADGVVGLFTQPGMLAGHLGAAALVGWWLARGERLALATVDLVVAWFVPAPVVLAGPLEAQRISSPSPNPLVPAGVRRHLSDVLTRRGPPVQPLRHSLLPV